MNLPPFLLLLFLVSTGFGQSMNKQKIIDPKLKMPGHLRALFDEGSKPLLDKIVGGSEAKYGDIPWQVSVKYNGEHNCGAAILNEFWLLSAAHCFHRNNRHITVTVGEHHLDYEDAEEHTFEVTRIHEHPEYNVETADYDFALIEITPSRDGRGIQFNKFVEPISLPAHRAALKDGDELLVSGWGYIKEDDGNNSPVLKKAEVPYVNQQTCKQSYAKITKITDRQFCAGYKEGGTDACRNDSGGPAAYKSEGQYVLFGIVSWGEGCARPDYYGVYGRVTTVLQWINNLINA